MAQPWRSPLVADPDPILGRDGRPILREDQLQKIRSCFAGRLGSLRPTHAWVHGPPGTGKTLCVRFLLDSEAKRIGARPVLINCAQRFTFLSVVEAILDVLKPLRPAQRTRERQLAVLRSVLSESRCIIALDEIDVLPTADVADLIHHLCSFPNTSLICIAATRQVLLKLPEHVSSRLAPRQVLFPRYRPDELAQILAHVAERGLRSNTCHQEFLQRIADASFGDARRAITLLRHTVQRAEEAGAARLGPEHLQLAEVNDGETCRREILDMLSSHHRLLHRIVSTGEPIACSKLEAAYLKACRSRNFEPVSPRTLSNYLGMLCRRGLFDRERGAGTAGWIYRLSGARSMTSSERGDQPA